MHLENTYYTSSDHCNIFQVHLYELLKMRKKKKDEKQLRERDRGRERERVRVEENLKSTAIHNIYQVTDEFSRTRLQLDYMLTISGDFK